MCCLTYENETYIHQKKGFPKLGKMVDTELGRGKVIRHNPLARQFTIRTEAGKEIDLGPDQLIRGPVPKAAAQGGPTPGRPKQGQRASDGKFKKRGSSKRSSDKQDPEKPRGQKNPPEEDASAGDNA
jgi:hypothetical protein